MTHSTTSSPNQETLARLAILRVLIDDVHDQVDALIPPEHRHGGLAAKPWVDAVNTAGQLGTELLALQDHVARSELTVLA